jgi:hypothetical protein
VHFYLADGANGTDPLQSSKSGLFANSNTRANTFSFLGFEVSALNIRVLGVGGLILSLLSLLILGWYIYDTTQRNQETLIRIKYGSLLMDVYDRGFENISPVIEVSDIDDLAKLAERQSTMILHMTRDFLHYYFVQSNGTTYRYVSSESRTERREIPPGEVNQSWINASSPISKIEHAQANAAPKKIVLSYDKTSSHNEQDNSK